MKPELKKEVKIYLGIILAAGVLAAAYWWYGFLTNGPVWKDVSNDGQKDGASFSYFSALDGTGVAVRGDIKPAVAGVMIDNHPDAMPQAGLSEARVVYEAPAEGATTRFLAIYARDQEVEKVGPVRSARPYYLEWLSEYGDGLYLHCGGSPDALNLIKQKNVFDANEFYWGRFYWREAGRIAPHNLYTDSDRWQKIFAEFGAARTTTDWSGWKFDAQSVAAEPNHAITIKYLPGYSVTWKYDETSGRYARFYGAEPHTDERGFGIQADDVIVQFADMKVLDEVGRREIETVGNGEARVLREGNMIRGTWAKEKSGARTRFYDISGNEIVLAPGQIWIEVVPDNAVIEATN